MPQVPQIDIAQRIDLLLPQWADATKFQALVRGLIDVVQTEIVDPLLILERAMNPDESEGILLDWLGQRIGMPRPFVRAADAEYWGMEGTQADVGQPWEHAPHWSFQRGIEDVEPLGDVTYRLLLKARARRLRGGADRETIEAVLAILFGNGYLDETGSPLRCVVVTDDAVLYRLVADSEFARVIPKPTGRAMIMARG